MFYKQKGHVCRDSTRQGQKNGKTAEESTKERERKRAKESGRKRVGGTIDIKAVRSYNCGEIWIRFRGESSGCRFPLF